MKISTRRPSIKAFTVVLLVSLLGFNQQLSSKPKKMLNDLVSLRSGKKASQISEYQNAKLILMHTPSDELFDGIIHPSAALFEDYFSADEAQKEHEGYIRALENWGAKVVTIRQILEASSRDSLQWLASNSLNYQFDSTQFKKAEVEKYRNEILSKLDKQALIKILLLQPTVKLNPTNTNTFVEASYIHQPLMNLFFQRDQTITTARGAIICKMNSSQRKLETEITAFCLRQLGISAIHRITGDDAFLEGGDFIPCGNIAFLGQGMRTTQAAVDQILDNDLLGQDTLVVVRDKFHWQMQMHLDTYFNVIDKDLVTLCANRLGAKNTDKEFLTIDIYARSGKDAKYKRVVTGQSFVDYLKGRKMDIIPISGEDELHYANNFLTVGARQIMAVGGQSKELAAKFKAKGVKVEWIPLENLIRGYGAAHCMTQVLIRGK